MEDPLVKDLRQRMDKVYDQLVAIVILLKGNPEDKKPLGVIDRLERVERWQRKVTTYGIAAVGVIIAAAGIFKFIQSILK